MRSILTPKKRVLTFPKLKGLLHPQLNGLVEKWQLYPFYIIALTQWTHIPIKKSYDNAATSYLLFSELQVLFSTSNDAQQPQLRNLPWLYYTQLSEKLSGQANLSEEARKTHLEKALKDLEQRPFIGNRGSYLHLLCDDCPIGPQWEHEKTSMTLETWDDLTHDPSEKFTTLSDLKDEYEANVKQKVAQRKALEAKNATSLAEDHEPRYTLNFRKRFVVVRILGKSRLFYFGKNDKDDRYAYRFSLRIMDISGVEATIDFWSQMCPAVYASLKEGDIVKLPGLRFRQNYAAVPVPMTSLLTGDAFSPSFEVSYTPSKEIGSAHKCVTVVGATADWFSSNISFAMAPMFVDDLVSTYSLKHASSMLVAQSLADALSSLSMTSALKSVVGFVGSVLPLERVKFFDSHLLTRWICILSTGSDPTVMMVQLAANSEAQNLQNLKFGQRILLTHLRIEVHHKLLIGISSIYTHIHTLENWEQARASNGKRQHEIEVLTPGPFPNHFDWPYTLLCNSPQEYARLYGAKLYAQPTFRQLNQVLSHPLPLVRHNLIILGRMEYTSFISAEDYIQGSTGYQTKETVNKVIESGSATAEIRGKLADYLFVAISSQEMDPEDATNAKTKNSKKTDDNTSSHAFHSSHYYCVILPLTAMHLCHGNMTKMLAISEQNKPFLQWLVREYHIVKRSYLVMIGVSVFNTGDEVLHTMNNTWRDTVKNKTDVPVFEFD